MVKLMEDDPTIGAVSPLIKYWSNPLFIQYAGYTRLNKITQQIFARAHKQPDYGQYSIASETYYAHGCAMMIPKRILSKVGLMNEDYFLYYEEHDWSQRIKDAGFRIYFQPKSVVLHKESISTGKDSTLKTYFLNRNRILFMRQHSKGIHKFLSHIYLYGISFPYHLLKYILKGDIKHIMPYLDAIIWTFTFKTKPQWKF